jgi:hypothetical protein
MQLKYFTFLIFISIFSVSATANSLLGKWSKLSKQGLMVVEFKSDEMIMSSSIDMSKNPQSVKVKYVELKESWGIEMLSDDGSVQGAMMAIPQGDNQIKFGAPGSAFFILDRVM